MKEKWSDLMCLFDVQHYQIPEIEALDWGKTKEQLYLFIQSYVRARERIGLVRLPKLDQSFSLFTEEISFSTISKQNLYYQEYKTLHGLFILGYTSILHPCRPEITERRRRIFLLRYFYGLPILLVSERINYQRNVIIDESKQAVLQFTVALDIHVQKES
ncbi:transcriptional regulator [Enterococcus hirae]|nr:transcriptional regulator [Enterococcus hirae]